MLQNVAEEMMVNRIERKMSAVALMIVMVDVSAIAMYFARFLEL